jgi:hypothetical protein
MTIVRDATKHIATEDIEVYKVVRSLGTCMVDREKAYSGLIYADFHYYGSTVYTEKDFIGAEPSEVKHVKTPAGIMAVHGPNTVRKGFHSFVNKEDAKIMLAKTKEFRYQNTEVVKFIIPAGSVYVKTEWGMNNNPSPAYASNRIRVA